MTSTSVVRITMPPLDPQEVDCFLVDPGTVVTIEQGDARVEIEITAGKSPVLRLWSVEGRSQR